MQWEIGARPAPSEPAEPAEPQRRMQGIEAVWRIAGKEIPPYE
jgi:hypothetical protein